MSNFIVSPNMNLILPTPGVDPGPDYANNLNSSLTIIDTHDHSPGNGVPVTPSGININTALSMNGNNLAAINSLELNNLGAPLTGVSPNLNCIYASNGELYYNDGSGNQVKITLSGSVNATSSGITNGTATAAFVAGQLVVKSTSTSGANIIMQSAILTNAGNLTDQLTLSAPTLSGSYGLQLPLLPLVTSFVTLDAAGNMSSVSSIVGSNIANQTITATQIANDTLTQTQMAPGILKSIGSSTTYLTSGSQVVPAGITRIYITAAGGGGGGGFGNTSAYGGGGGGGGGFIQGWFTVVPGETLTVTVGSGGAGGTSGISGSAGSATTIVGSSSGTLVDCDGGGGGQVGAASGAGGNGTGGTGGGLGTNGQNGDVGLAGAGGAGFAQSRTYSGMQFTRNDGGTGAQVNTQGGGGGGGSYGAGGSAGAPGQSAAANTGGGGGGGNGTTRLGGNGGSGIVIIDIA